MAKVALVEVFASVQGEGYHAGRTAVFVRFAGCPLACEFAPGVVCDTPYQQANMKLDVTELFKYIHEIYPSSWEERNLLQSISPNLSPMLILTGGEPTASPMFDKVVETARDDAFYVAVETNGTKYRDGLNHCHWITVSPKMGVPQTSQALHHNKNPQSTKLDPLVKTLLAARAMDWDVDYGGEYRYVVSLGGLDCETPPYDPAPCHYVSPAVNSDGSGMDHKGGFPGFVPGAVECCLSIVQAYPRWRISLQTHKFLGVR